MQKGRSTKKSLNKKRKICLPDEYVRNICLIENTLFNKLVAWGYLF